MIRKILASAGAVVALMTAAPMVVAAPVSGPHSAGQEHAFRLCPAVTAFAAFAGPTGLVAGDTALTLKVDVPEFGALVPTFQVFDAGGNGVSGSHLAFKLNDQPTGCIEVMFDDHTYHDFPDFFPLPGLGAFEVKLLGQASGAPDAHADARFGNTLPAVPMPPAALTLVGGTDALGAFRFRCPACSVITNKGVL